MGSQKQQVESTIRELYDKAGGHPSEDLVIKPCDGSWEDALSYEVTSSGGKHTRVWRRDLDDGNRQALLVSLAELV